MPLVFDSLCYIPVSDLRLKVESRYLLRDSSYLHMFKMYVLVHIRGLVLTAGGKSEIVRVTSGYGVLGEV